MKQDIAKLKSLLGERVLVDYSKVQDGSNRHTPEDWDGKPFTCVVVGINRMNYDNNGCGANNGELNIYPTHSGRNWGNVDVRMVSLMDKPHPPKSRIVNAAIQGNAVQDIQAIQEKFLKEKKYSYLNPMIKNEYTFWLEAEILKLSK